MGEKVSGCGVYSNMLTFLAGSALLPCLVAFGPPADAAPHSSSPRACIGYKFSLLELKAYVDSHLLSGRPRSNIRFHHRILSVLIDTFAFAEREPGLPITRRSVLVSRSLVVGEEEALGYAMPLRVSVAKRDG